MTLAEEFRQMCQTYFPRWREATVWCLEEDAHASWITVQDAQHATPDQGSCGPPHDRLRCMSPLTTSSSARQLFCTRYAMPSPPWGMARSSVHRCTTLRHARWCWVHQCWQRRCVVRPKRIGRAGVCRPRRSQPRQDSPCCAGITRRFSAGVGGHRWSLGERVGLDAARLCAQHHHQQVHTLRHIQMPHTPAPFA